MRLEFYKDQLRYSEESIPFLWGQPLFYKWFIHSFILSGYFYSASSSPLPLRSAPDTARILCRNFTPKRHRQLWVKDLPKVPTWARVELEWESNPRSFGRKASTLPLCHLRQAIHTDVRFLFVFVSDAVLWLRFLQGLGNKRRSKKQQFRSEFLL